LVGHLWDRYISTVVFKNILGTNKKFHKYNGQRRVWKRDSRKIYSSLNIWSGKAFTLQINRQDETTMPPFFHTFVAGA